MRDSGEFRWKGVNFVYWYPSQKYIVREPYNAPQIAVKPTQFKLATFKMNFIALSCITECFLLIRKIDLQFETKK